MPGQRRPTDPLPRPKTWRVSDELWTKVQPILAQYDPPKAVGRPRIDQRRALEGTLYRMCRGIKWNQLPQEFGDDSSVHRTCQRWRKLEVLERIWAVLVAEWKNLAG